MKILIVILSLWPQLLGTNASIKLGKTIEDIDRVFDSLWPESHIVMYFPVYGGMVHTSTGPVGCCFNVVLSHNVLMMCTNATERTLLLLPLTISLIGLGYKCTIVGVLCLDIYVSLPSQGLKMMFALESLPCCRGKLTEIEQFTTIPVNVHSSIQCVHDQMCDEVSQELPTYSDLQRRSHPAVCGLAWGSSQLCLWRWLQNDTLFVVVWWV